MPTKERKAKKVAVAPLPAAGTASLPEDSFFWRHIGPREEEQRAMLEALGFASLGELVDAAVPSAIRLKRPLDGWAGLSERAALARLREVAGRNQVFRSYIGMGYSGCFTPPVIQRNILENPGWYTQYTPYQAEIAQGRLEALLNFQTMIADLTRLDVANASLLDEGTAAAEAMHLCHQAKTDEKARAFFVAEDCHPQTIAVVRGRALPLGIDVVVGDPAKADFHGVFGALLQYPATDGAVRDYSGFCEKAHARGALVTVAADLLALTLLRAPGEFGADIAVGNTQRFGVPLGYGGPHAAYFATRDAHKRLMPGRIVGVSKDAAGRPAFRLALQTREQHIRRERATSNVCTAQVLLAVIASMYSVYHGPKGLKRIAGRVHALTEIFAAGLARMGLKVAGGARFDTVRVDAGSDVKAIVARAQAERVNLRVYSKTELVVALDETTDEEDVSALWRIFGAAKAPSFDSVQAEADGLEPFARQSEFLTHPVFNSHHSETEMLRYLRRLESKDLSLTSSMIPLGSCTMKLNATAEMFPVTWPEFGALHPFAPVKQAAGYQELFAGLEGRLAALTGFDRVSLMPNAGSQGEYAGLLVIRAYHQARGQGKRDVCLIPQSAHGTNPASAAMAGMRVVVVRCDDAGNVDMADLRAQAQAHKDDLAALMVTYPSTHGVFEETIREIADVVHAHGGQVYMDGANLNALLGICRPADFGADVCHMNLHKTFCIPHGGGGPGMGPIGVKKHLAPYLPGHPVIATGGEKAIAPVSAAPWGSASILPISWMYIEMMGSEGLAEATRVAILNANYVAKRLGKLFPVLYKGKGGLVAHECILDLRPLKDATDVGVEDVAKRLMDFGFHAPTVSFPVAGTLMIEPTESESKEELDRFCDAMEHIHAEIQAVQTGAADRADNPLKNAPHTAEAVTASRWDHKYSREQAAYPVPWLKTRKFWPSVARIDNPFGDRNFVCTCPPLETYT